MALFVSIMATLILAIGVFGLTSPAGMIALISLFRSEAGLLATMLLRLTLGAALWRIAPSSRTPAILMALGILYAGSALALPLIGLSRFQAMLSWWARRPVAVIWAWSAAAILLGVFLLWSVN